VAAFYVVLIVVAVFIFTRSANLAISSSTIGPHRLVSTVSPWVMMWIGVSNLILVLVTIGVFFPWARVRLARYRPSKTAIVPATALEEFVSEAASSAGVIGEEIASFFDIDIGL